MKYTKGEVKSGKAKVIGGKIWFLESTGSYWNIEARAKKWRRLYGKARVVKLSQSIAKYRGNNYGLYVGSHKKRRSKK
ncbi:hypothetical protein H8D36_06720 [archaeon]|nr:hypothetical protein [archaeon]